MADTFLGKLSGEELLHMIEQLDNNDEYFCENEKEDGTIISLDDIGLNVEIGVSITESDSTVDLDENDINDNIKDPDYQPDESLDSQTEDELDVNETVLDKNVSTAVTTNIDINNNRHEDTAGKEIPNGPEKKRGRKRIRAPEEWARNVRKRSRAEGNSYTNSRGRHVPKVEKGSPCKCKNKCYDNLSEECKDRVFNEFWGLGDKHKQDAYIFSMIDKEPVKRRRPKTGEKQNERNYSYKYFVRQNDGNKTEVCVKSFQSLHGIGLKRVKRIRKSPTTTPSDRRGQHPNRPNRVPNYRLEQIRQHISSFPKRQSHYSREDNPNKYYLHENLNIRRMWLLYLSQYEPEQLELMRKRSKYSPKVKLWLYVKVFNSDFNMSFGMPRTDTCANCDRLELSILDADKTSDTERKENLQKEKEMHLRKAQGAYDKLKEFTEEAKTNSKLDAYTFDFQQNLPVPCVTSSDLFYMRQLWTYNFGVHDLKSGDGIMHIWDESTAQRGSSEVCSCLEKTILNRHSKADRLVLFSDGCGGQNKNKAMLSFLFTLCEDPNKPYTRIDHFFLVRGHTYLPNDRDFALIEKRKKTESPLVPQDYVPIIEKSKTVQPFKVVQVQSDDIKDYKGIAEKSVKQNLTSTDGEKVLLRSAMWFSYGISAEMDPITGSESLFEHSGEVWCRYTLNPLESWKKVKLYKRGINSANLKAGKKYNGRVPIKAAKYKDLNDLATKGLLSSSVASFYRSLPHDSPTCRQDSDNDDYVD